MRLSPQGGFVPLKRFRPILSLLLVLLFVCNAAGQIRPAEISSFVRPASRIARGFFGSYARFAGGVVPRGSATFSGPSKARLTPAQLKQLKLVILDRDKLRNGEPDFDVVGIRLGNNVYRLAVQDDLVYPMMKFIERGSYIAYTIPDDYDEDYFRINQLLEVAGGYVAREFRSPPHAEFLEQVDLWTETEPIPDRLKKQLVLGANGFGARALGSENLAPGTYTNADFDVDYKVFLTSARSEKLIDIAGLPLRYYWDTRRNGNAVVSEVEVFAFPEKEYDSQYRAILFFQTTAVLREFRRFNRPEFNRFMNEVGAAVGRQ